MGPPEQQPFDRVSSDAKQVLDLTKEEAERAGNAYIGTEHLLLAILDHGDNVGARALGEMNVTAEPVRAALESVTRPEPKPAGAGQPTARTKRALEAAFQQARAMGHDYVGPEHLLLGLVIEGEGIAARVLHELGVDAERTRAEVTRLLAEPGVVARQQSTVERRPSSKPAVTLSSKATEALVRAHELAEAEGAAEVGLEHLRQALAESSEQ